MNEEKRKALIEWLESMPWWKDLPYADLKETVEICSHEILRLEKKERELEMELGRYKRSYDSCYRQIEMWMKLSMSHEKDAKQLEAELDEANLRIASFCDDWKYNFEMMQVEIDAWKELVKAEMDLICAWQIDWFELANDPDYKPVYNKKTIELRKRLDALLTATPEGK